VLLKDGRGEKAQGARGRLQRPRRGRVVFHPVCRVGIEGASSFITMTARKISEAGGSLRDIQELAGHSSLATTQRYIQAIRSPSVIDLI
jgi:integrase